MTARKRTTTTPAAKAAAKPAPAIGAAAAAAGDTALLAFLAGWQQLQEGALTAGRSVVLHYEPARLAEAVDGDTPQDIVGFARFLPSGVVRHTMLRTPASRRAKAPAARVAAEIAIPHETQHLELWFKGADATGATIWDSRFGHNYRFDVMRAEPSAADTLAPMPTAVVEPGRIHVADDAAVKENGFPSRAGYPSGMSSQQTTLHVAAHVHGKAVPRRVWIEVRAFDGDGVPIASEARDLTAAPRTETANGAAALYRLDDLLYQGATASPGSVTPKPDVRTVQYRLYGTIGRKTYTDGVLHRCELATDAVTTG
jgi:hypothetical protein